MLPDAALIVCLKLFTWHAEQELKPSQLKSFKR